MSKYRQNCLPKRQRSVLHFLFDIFPAVIFTVMALSCIVFGLMYAKPIMGYLSLLAGVLLAFAAAFSVETSFED
jgi:uncharacterized membrane protein